MGRAGLGAVSVDEIINEILRVAKYRHGRPLGIMFTRGKARRKSGLRLHSRFHPGLDSEIFKHRTPLKPPSNLGNAYAHIKCNKLSGGTSQAVPCPLLTPSTISTNCLVISSKTP